MIFWQWEQGRGEYFRFENILAMSRVLLEKEGMPVSDLRHDKELRELARHAARLAFPPHKKGYTVWRNYARVFKIAMLASDIPAPKGGQILKCTDVCRHLARDKFVAATDYVSYLMRKFYLPGPVFGAKNYNPAKGRIFPFCAIVRLLAARTALDKKAFCASPDDIKNFLFSRGVAGDEDIGFFQSIAALPISWKTADQRRQVREMLVFASQCSFLKWNGQKLCMDLPQDSLAQDAVLLFNRMAPVRQKQERLAHDEIMNLGKAARPYSRLILPSEINAIVGDDPMAERNLRPEGKRRIVNHLVIERSPKLREMFFARHKNAVCDITGAPRHAGFPWVRNILEIHHVTPLSSSVYSNKTGTGMDDLVALTPTSHRAVHAYYRDWMRSHSRDFKDKQEAREVYHAAKQSYARSGGIKKWA